MIERFLVACEGALIFGGGLCLGIVVYGAICGGLLWVGLLP